jgi:hypothetical protein
MYPLTRSTSRSRFFGLPFSPASLFAAGEQGFWYDPSDYSTLFQDSAGTTPVTAVEQAVGLMLDKSKGGVGTNGAARYNLLTFSEQFDNAAWTKSNVTVTANAVVAPDGTTTADKLVETAVNDRHFTYQQPALIGGAYIYSVYAKAAERSWLVIDFTTGANSYCWFDLSTGTLGTVDASRTASIESVGNGWYRCSVAVASLSGNAFTATFASTANNVVSYAGDITKGLYIWGADLRLASQAALTPTYQPITASWSATIPGNHAFQTNNINRPILRARYNLLTYSEQFDDGVWSSVGAQPITANTTTAPDGTLTADTFTAQTNGAFTNYKFRSVGTLVGSHTESFSIKKGTQKFFFIDLYRAGTDYVAVFDVDAGSYVGNAGQTSFDSTSITSQGNGWWRLTATVNLSSASYTIAFGTATGNNAVQAVGDSVFVWGADVRPTSQATGLIGPTYQRVAAATDYDTTGFLPYVAFNGTNSCMTTNSIDFTATDKMTVFAGVRKLSGTPTGVMYELSANTNTNNGTFYAAAPLNNATDYGWVSKGTVQGFVTPTGYTAPRTDVLTAIGDISGDVATLRVNGVQAATSGGDQGTGNYGNYPLFIGARDQTSFYLNGWLTSLIGRGAATSAGQISATETWVNSKTGAF